VANASPIQIANESDLCNRGFAITGEACASYRGIAVRDFIARLARCQPLRPISQLSKSALISTRWPENLRKFVPSDALWIGDNPNRGLGVFSFGQYRLARANAEAVAITYALPARVIGPSTFNLVALWAHYGKTPIRVGALGPTLLALYAYANILLEQPSIVAGGRNNHIRWDKPSKASNHANAVTASSALGLVSAYHAFHGLEQGAERHPTLFGAIVPEPGRLSTSIISLCRGRQRNCCGGSASARMPSGLLPA
jgi:hypothetical protein